MLDQHSTVLNIGTVNSGTLNSSTLKNAISDSETLHQSSIKTCNI